MKNLKATKKSKQSPKKLDITEHAHLVKGGTSGYQDGDPKTQQTVVMVSGSYSSEQGTLM